MKDKNLEKAKELAIEMINTDLKMCTTCNLLKPRTTEYFFKEKKSADGLKGECRECKKVREAERDRKQLMRKAEAEQRLTLAERLITKQKSYQEDELTLMNYKEPLTKVENGFGYYGTLTSTQDGAYVQCHICGRLFNNLSGHIHGFHKLTDKEYKKMFGLAFTTALLSENQREHYKKQTLEFLRSLTDEEKEEYRKRAKARYREGRKKRLAQGQPTLQLESMNKRGTCPDQLLAKIVEVSESIGHTPSKSEFIAHCNTQRYVHLIYKVYGSWSNALTILGMEQKKNRSGGRPDGKYYTDEELLEYLRMFTLEHGDIPTQTDFYRGLLPSYDTYLRHFGTIEKARQEAGVYDLLASKEKADKSTKTND